MGGVGAGGLPGGSAELGGVQNSYRRGLGTSALYGGWKPPTGGVCNSLQFLRSHRAKIAPGAGRVSRSIAAGPLPASALRRPAGHYTGHAAEECGSAVGGNAVHACSSATFEAHERQGVLAQSTTFNNGKPVRRTMW